MRLLSIVLKDLLRSLRSYFLLAMALVAPLLLTGLLYLAFGSVSKETGGFALPVTRVQVVNLDQPQGSGGFAAGALLVHYLQGPELDRLVQVTLAPDEASARSAVERQEADVALVIPPNLTTALTTGQTRATVQLYHDPTLTTQPVILKTLVGGLLDGFSGTTIAVVVTLQQMQAHGLAIDEGTQQAIVERYAAWAQDLSSAQQAGTESTVMLQRAPTSAPGTPGNSIIGSVMAAMMIFFGFFTAGSGAATIVYEEEAGTLARMFSTPTPRTFILAGKLAAVVVTLVVQVGVLLLAGSLLFGICWGRWDALLLVAAGLVACAAGFGILVVSWMKNARQTGPVMAGIVTLTGMLGGLFAAPVPNLPALFGTITLAMPQGWALRGFRLLLSGAGVGEVLVPAAVLAGAGVLFFAAGTLFLRRRCG